MNNTTVSIGIYKFVISYEGTIVKVRQDDTGDFDEALSIIDGQILPKFHQSQPGSIWGCDGIGYVMEKKNGRAFRNKSGVGRIKYQQGIDRLRTGIPDPYVGS